MVRKKVAMSTRHRKISLAPQARKSVARITKSVIGKRAEGKYFDVAAAATGVSTGGTVVPLTDVPQGQTDVTRNGDSLFMRNYKFNYIITGTGDITNIMRVMIVQCRYSTATIGVNDVLTVASNPMSDYNHDRIRQFKVIYDRQHYITSYVADSVTGTIGVSDKQIQGRRPLLYKLGRKKVQFEGAGTTGQYKLFAIFLSDSAAIAHPSIQYYGRVNFTDS